jgi:hypothetical protein
VSTPEKPISERLSELAPEARARVESALKPILEAELTQEARGPVSPHAREFSRGIIFSRSRSRAVAGEVLEDQALLRQAAELDEATFTKFADRLSALKNIKDAGTGPGGGT